MLYDLVLKKGGNLKPDRPTGRMPLEDKARGDAPTGQGASKPAYKPPGTRRGA